MKHGPESYESFVIEGGKNLLHNGLLHLRIKPRENGFRRGSVELKRAISAIASRFPRACLNSVLGLATESISEKWVTLLSCYSAAVTNLPSRKTFKMQRFVGGNIWRTKMRKYRDYLVEELVDYEEAVTFFQVVLEEYEKDRDNLAFLLDLESIIAAQGKESKLAPQVYLMRGLVHHSLKQYGSAVEDYNTVLELNPADSMAHVYRTLAYYQSGDKDRALANFHRACCSLWSTYNPLVAKANDGSGTKTVLHESAKPSAPYEDDVAENIKHEIACRVMHPTEIERNFALRSIR
jgi:tetratricopeptide (TPR) repeat protein